MVKNSYPHCDDHLKEWEKLASNIASIKEEVREIKEGEILPNSKQGSLTIIGSGIESMGVSIGDQKLIENADKLLFCVADPVTVVWLKKLRPDALDLYVLYGENKTRYTTYMQMTEAQLYWVRQGLNVVVVFYGHPGIFVLSTHRAILLARREGYKAIMKAGVCALDTLCADLGVDPCQPGLQTYEATDALIRQKNLDTTVHVVLWQVGLIGELGYRRQGYLNNNFSYFINWLQEIYDNDYQITHYIGSRYPTIPPLIEIYKLSKLHEPETQLKITGLSTFYIPPKDITKTNEKIVQDLGPLREIGKYQAKEMKAFDAFANFKIPSSYKWQENTPASNFLIALRFDTKLQALYEKDPIKALDDPRFKNLSDKERSLLVSRDPGALQIASKGLYIRSKETEKFLISTLTKKSLCTSLLKEVEHHSRANAREALNSWLATNHHKIELSLLSKSFDFIVRNHLFPWTGIYLENTKKLIVTIIGNQARRQNSIIYINNHLIKKFSYTDGTLKWNTSLENPYNGFVRVDADLQGIRRIVGKIWKTGEEIPINNNFVGIEVKPDRKRLLYIANKFYNSSDISEVYGTYTVKIKGRHAKNTNSFVISKDNFIINNTKVKNFSFKMGHLSWSGGDKEYFSGKIAFLVDPISQSIEVYGISKSEYQENNLMCYGLSIQGNKKSEYLGPEMPKWASEYLCSIVEENSKSGGLLLWHKWEKANYTALVLNKILSKLY